METEKPTITNGQTPCKHRLPQNVGDIQNTIIAIVVDYSDRKAAYNAAYNWLTEIPRDLTNEWLELRKITTPEDLRRKLAYLQTKHRAPILAERKQARKEFEKWLWENDPASAAHRVLNKLFDKTNKKKQFTGRK